MPVSRGSKGLIRDINNARVLGMIQAKGAVSRSEIAKATGLPPPTVTQIVAEFMVAGLVVDADPSESRSPDVLNGDDERGAILGRPPILISLAPRAAFAVGVKLFPGGFDLAVTDLSGAVVAHRTRALSSSAPAEVFESVGNEVRRALVSAGLSLSTVLALGIGMPGLIDHAAGRCRHSPLLGWSDVDARSMLEGLVDLPVYVDNDVNMLTAAEIAFGAGQDVDDFLTVTVGRGIGLGIVLRGEMYRGARGGAGEFGHVKTGGARRCECGALGCIESVASEIAIREQIAEGHGWPEATMERCLTWASEGDPVALEVLWKAGAVVGQGVGNLANIFNPSRVIVTGEGVRMGRFFLDPMRDAIRGATFGLLGDDLDVVVQEWGDEAWSQGAASIVIHEMLKPPIYETDVEHPLDRLLDRRGQEESSHNRIHFNHRPGRSRPLAAGRR